MKFKLETERTIHRLRKKFPQFKWKYNPRSMGWECEAGYAVWVVQGDEEGEFSRLCFYPKTGTPIWV